MLQSLSFNRVRVITSVTMSKSKILGIDLGTTNSAFAVMQGDNPEILPNSDGDRTTPSVVAFTEHNERLIGRQAKNQAVQNPENTVESVKRHMGKDNYTINLRGEEFTPEEISAMILQRIKSDAEEVLGEEISKAVITVPAYFNDKERQATKNAGKIAGFEVERIVNEPTAAAMSYGVEGNNNVRVLVYDLGGGTFDVSILSIQNGIYDVIATNGDRNLGGDDWDQKLIDWLVEDFKEEHGVDLTQDRQALQRLRDAAEEAKKDLSTREKTKISLPFIASSDKTGPIHLEKTVPRSKFEELTKTLLQRTIGPTQNALEDAGLSMDDMDDVLLVGGGTRMPMIREQMPNAKKSTNPDEAVGSGAAVQAGVLSGSVDDTVLLDVTPLSLGVEVKGGLFKSLINKNTTIPTEESNVFTTAEDNQTSVQIKVYQGERKIAEHNELLGEFTLTGIPPASAGTPHIKVNFSIDEDGIVHVEAEDEESGAAEQITIEGGSGLSDEEIEEMMREAEKHAEEDQQKRERIQEMNRGDTLVTKAGDFIEQNQDKLQASDIDNVERRVEELKEVLAEDEPSVVDLNRGCNKLENLLSKLGAKIDSDVERGMIE